MAEAFVIRRLKAQTAAQAEADAVVAAQLKQKAITSWFEGQDLKKSNPKEVEREKATVEADLRVASEQLVKVRRERIRQLYAAETAQFQMELAAKGLTIDTGKE